MAHDPCGIVIIVDNFASPRRTPPSHAHGVGSVNPYRSGPRARGACSACGWCCCTPCRAGCGWLACHADNHAGTSFIGYPIRSCRCGIDATPPRGPHHANGAERSPAWARPWCPVCPPPCPPAPCGESVHGPIGYLERRARDGSCRLELGNPQKQTGQLFRLRQDRAKAASNGVQLLPDRLNPAADCAFVRRITLDGVCDEPFLHFHNKIALPGWEAT